MDLSPDKKDVPESERPIQAEFAKASGTGTQRPPPLGVAADPWAHRSTAMRCNTCMFFVIKKPTELGIVANAERGYLGRCRRRCPTMSGYPAVFETDWCGDHKIDENKI
jgi:hypothetical protein